MPGDSRLGGWNGGGMRAAAGGAIAAGDRADGRKPLSKTTARWAGRLAAGVCASALLGTARALADPLAAAASFPFHLDTFDVIQFAMFLGAMGAALLSAGWLIRERGKIAGENRALRDKVADLAASLQKSDALLNLGDKRIVIWEHGNGRPEIIGSLPEGTGAPDGRSEFLAFGRWLRADSAAALDRAVVSLRDKARSFALVVETTKGVPLDAVGRTIGGLAVISFASLGDVEAARATLEVDNRALNEALGTLRRLLDRIDMPVWTRDVDGRLSWVNSAYARNVEVAEPTTAVNENRELLGTVARQKIERERREGQWFHDHLSTVVGGDRHVFDVTDVTGPSGSAGMALDISETEAVRAEFERTVKSHSDTLDQFNTAVAIFDPQMKLRFYNQAFQKLWGLDVSFLETAPDNAMLFDHLRSAGKLPEQPEWRRWKESMLGAYRAVESQEHLWHLPDGRTLRVVANPHPSGVTWVFENLTEKFDLESRYNALIKVQGETLDHLAEGVAVFGPDGRVRLSNPAFATLWSLPAEFAAEGVHISAIQAACGQISDPMHWETFVTAITGFDDKREAETGQIDLAGGLVLSFALVPLPNGQTMLTFVDVTDSVHVERALTDRNEALERADRMKNDFVQHVSYELRSPLTNIIGFAELMRNPSVGPLNQRQVEYLDHISTSSSVLLTIVNDILDLATVDAGIMELDIADVPVARAVASATEKVADRLREHEIALDVAVAPGAGSFRADAERVKQVLYNLLSNAANYAPEGSIVSFRAHREGGDVVFSVHDDGPGMPPDILDTVFKRFEPRSNGGRRRGAGLGLSIVKSFVELHGGSVEIDTEPGSGTTVTCRFPVEARTFRAAAE